MKNLNFLKRLRTTVHRVEPLRTSELIQTPSSLDYQILCVVNDIRKITILLITSVPTVLMT